MDPYKTQMESFFRYPLNGIYSLKDFLNGTKGIDDIFLELASKWDTLDIATQRYIATTAAGSRQQSFLSYDEQL